MSGLGTDKSDIDMCLLVKPLLNDARSDALGYLQNIQIVLQDCGMLVIRNCWMRMNRCCFRICGNYRINFG